MDTLAYKSRAWWALRALDYAHDVVDMEDEREAGNGRPSDVDQMIYWTREMHACTAAAHAPDGDERLTPIYVDRAGNLRPEYRYEPDPLAALLA